MDVTAGDVHVPEAGNLGDVRLVDGVPEGQGLQLVVLDQDVRLVFDGGVPVVVLVETRHPHVEVQQRGPVRVLQQAPKQDLHAAPVQPGDRGIT